MMCPLRAKEFNSNISDQECQPNCAWRLTYASGPSGLDMYAIGSCAIAVLAQSADSCYGIQFEKVASNE